LGGFDGEEGVLLSPDKEFDSFLGRVKAVSGSPFGFEKIM